MTDLELRTRSSGNIGMIDRILRVSMGIAVLIGLMYMATNTGDAYPWIKLAAVFVVLTGIAGWDPLYSAFRSTVRRFGQDDSTIKPGLTMS